MNRRDFIKYGTLLAGVGGFCVFCNDGIAFSQDNISEESLYDTRPCKKPFEYCEINVNGNINPCCLTYLKYSTSLGNIEKNDFNEVWNGKALTDLRKKVLKGDFSMCRRNICTMYDPCSADEIPENYQKGPKELKISYDTECNYKCITCRDVVKINSQEEMDKFENVYLPRIVAAAKDIKILSLLGSGDPLFSRHSKHLMKEMVKANPKIKLNIFTNGFLLDEKLFTDLGIENNIQGISVSVDAIKRETYKKILRTDGFDTVIKNIENFSKWKRDGKIDWMTINFVAHIMNYKEMPDFLKFAQKLDITAFFTTYNPWPTSEYRHRYHEVAVFEPKNKHYNEFVKILKNPIFKDEEHCFLEPRLYKIVYS